ncbi:hypothetical protein ES708_17368 [subsurface metagenome]
MKILSIHNKYLNVGGEDISKESEEAILKDKGISVDIYEENNKRIKEIGYLNTAIRTIWSKESYDNILQLIKKNNYDLIHVQNFFPLISPSIYYAAKKLNVPVVQTLRNYRLICPNGLLFTSNKICERCINKIFPWPSIVYKCYRNNSIATIPLALMLFFHNIMKTWKNKVDAFITLTNFEKNKYIEGGFPKDKIYVKPNFVYPDPGPGKGNGDYAIYVGSLTIEKGVRTLIEAWKLLKIKKTLKIIGTGPLKNYVINETKKNDNINYLGFKNVNEVYDLIGEAKFLIFPLEMFGTFGRVIIESFAKGTPVIVPFIGALAELVNKNQTGLFYKKGNIKDLTSKIFWAFTHDKEIKEMRKKSRQEFEFKYTAEINFNMIVEIYNNIKTIK